MIPRRDAWRATGGDRRDETPAERLATLAREIGRLAPNWRDPERYFETRSELAEKARRLARALEERTVTHDR
jgi:hypothetical protein